MTGFPTFDAPIAPTTEQRAAFEAEMAIDPHTLKTSDLVSRIVSLDVMLLAATIYPPLAEGRDPKDHARTLAKREEMAAELDMRVPIEDEEFGKIHFQSRIGTRKRASR